MSRRIEMIEEYIVQQSDGTDYNPPSYIWTDNKGQLVRCKDCKWFGGIGCAIRIVDDSDKPKEEDFCSFAERSGE